jgi:hypothetical protein
MFDRQSVEDRIYQEFKSCGLRRTMSEAFVRRWIRLLLDVVCVK